MAIVDMFLKIDGVDGEAQDATHKNEIQLLSWSFGATNAGSASTGLGMGSGRATMQDFHFVMTTQTASSKLFQACATGDHIKSALLTCRKAGGKQQEYLTWKFTDILVSSFQTGGSGEVLPQDQISFNFTQVDVTYKIQNQDGSLGAAFQAGYNIKTQQKS